MTAVFDVPTFLRGLDAVFAGPGGSAAGEQYLLAGLQQAGDDDGARLAILNELMGLYRGISSHERALAIAEDAQELIDQMGIVATDAGAITLINIATAQRAAGRYELALATYERALTIAEATLPPHDRRLAALHNNLSILHSDQQRPSLAAQELRAALAILEASSADPERDIDVASTCSNLALVELQLADGEGGAGASLERAPGDHLASAEALARRSLAIFDRGDHESNPHFASALACHAQVSLRLGRASDAVVGYQRALGIIATAYGTMSDAYAVTASNLAEAERAAGSEVPDAASAKAATPDPGPSSSAATAPTLEAPSESPAAPALAATLAIPAPCGLEVARRYWEQVGRPMLAERYPDHLPRIAVGLVGHGSECYGFDDEISRDHDFGAGFCLWLTAADYAEIGEQLQADYDALPRDVEGFVSRLETPRAAGRRVGVFEIGAFFREITGYAEAPSTAHEWLLLEESTLAAATNGAVFADPLGTFSGVRQGFRRMPKDVRLALISRRLGMASQAGQYNLPRMLARGDGEAAWLSVNEFASAVASLVFLLNKPTAVGYLPYYKWRFAALRRLSDRMASRLPGVVGNLSQLLRLASAACFDEAASGIAEANPVLRRVHRHSSTGVCAAIVDELVVQGLTSSKETFLEWQRPQIAARIRMSGCEMVETTSAADATARIETAEVVVSHEWTQFGKVNGQDGRAQCQDDWCTFRQMRLSQFLTWPLPLLRSYADDLDAADARGQNLLTQKYARMMASTEPERYARDLAPSLPVLSETRVEQQEAVIAIQVRWAEQFRARYPKLGAAMRVMRTGEDTLEDTSFETYLRGELGTYSSRTFALYRAMVNHLDATGDNLTAQTVRWTVLLGGFADLDEAEAAQ